MAKRKNYKKVMYVLVAIIVILAAAFVYTLYQTKTAQSSIKVTNDTEANNIQQNVTGAITNIRSTLEQLNRSLG